MAKREAPEINAGSMADIAFLLLIFFLVTTTMNKDTAYLRKIPKKVKSDQPQPPIQKKNIYKITINSKNVIKARDSIIQPRDIENLSDNIKYFYLVNRGEKTNRKIDYPYYAYGTVALYKNNLISQQNRLEALENQLEKLEDRDGQSSLKEKLNKMIAQSSDAIGKWRTKLEMMKMFVKYSGQSEMPVISIDAHIRLEAFNDTDYSAYVAVQSEVQEAVIDMRDDVAEKLFGVPYSTMEVKYQQQRNENTPEIRELRKRMDLIETLFPLKLIEVKPKR